MSRAISAGARCAADGGHHDKTRDKPGEPAVTPTQEGEEQGHGQASGAHSKPQPHQHGYAAGVEAAAATSGEAPTRQEIPSKPPSPPKSSEEDGGGSSPHWLFLFVQHLGIVIPFGLLTMWVSWPYHVHLQARRTVGGGCAGTFIRGACSFWQLGLPSASLIIGHYGDVFGACMVSTRVPVGTERGCLPPLVSISTYNTYHRTPST